MKKKLNLDELKVKSFVTNLNGNTAETVKGGLLSIIWCKPKESVERCDTGWVSAEGFMCDEGDEDEIAALN